MSSNWFAIFHLEGGKTVLQAHLIDHISNPKNGLQLLPGFGGNSAGKNMINHIIFTTSMEGIKCFFKLEDCIGIVVSYRISIGIAWYRYK